MVSVVIVDDQSPFRRAARAVVGRIEGFEVVGEAGSAEEGIDLVDELQPELVLMDVNLPGMNGVEATRRIGFLDDGEGRLLDEQRLAVRRAHPIVDRVEPIGAGRIGRGVELRLG